MAINYAPILSTVDFSSASIAIISIAGVIAIIKVAIAGSQKVLSMIDDKNDYDNYMSMAGEDEEMSFSEYKEMRDES